MITQTSTQPNAEPVALNEAKLHLRVDHTADDELITSMIASTRQWCEAYEGQAYMMRTCKAYYDGFSNMELRLPPLVSVSSVQYYDTSGSLQTLSSSYYTVDTDSIPARVYLAYGYSWPSTYDIPKSVIVTYTCGYAAQFTAATSDTITVGNAAFSNGDIVRAVASSEDNAALPSPLAVNTDYYVGDVSGSTLKLYTDSGLTSVVDITDTGTGTFYIGLAGVGLVPDRAIWAIKVLLSHLYEHRGSDDMKIPSTVKNLLCERVFY